MGSFDGSWMNKSGDVLRLKSHGSFIFGSFQSGSENSHQYHVCGYGDASLIASPRGLGLSLSMLWRPIDQPQSRENSHWVSGFGGQMLVDEEQGSRLLLNHSLFVTKDQEGQGLVGAYLDKDSFARTDLGGATLASIGKFRVSDHLDPINGVWFCQTSHEDCSLELQLKDGVSGWLDGFLSLHGTKYVLQGFTDNQSEFEIGRPKRQGLSVCASLSDGSSMVLTGYWESETERLVLLEQVSCGTDSTKTSMQTRVQTHHFLRAPRD